MEQFRHYRTGVASSALVLSLQAALLVAGCGRKPPAQSSGAGIPEVVIETVKAQSLPVTTELPGRIEPMRVAQVRAQATGIVLSREFSQGSNVKAGQVLYRIDPAPYQAALESAAAGLAQAEAALTQAELLAERYKPLVGINAVSKQNYDNAVSAAAQAKASVAAERAAQQSAQINLGYCTVTAPISGRIGLALVTEGALVSSSAATEMAVIQQMDPIYLDLTESSAEALRLRQQVEARQLESLPTGEAKVTMVLDGGVNYPRPGKLLFQDISVDPTSGMITLRAEFPNPDEWLLPGMFALGRLEQAVAPQVLLVAQPAVTIGPNGQASVMRLTSANEAESQPVELGAAVGTNWVIKTGLLAGERVIVEGLQKVHPGMKVKPASAEPVESRGQ